MWPGDCVSLGASTDAMKVSRSGGTLADPFEDGLVQEPSPVAALTPQVAHA